MIQEIFRLYAERGSFFGELILQHIRIAGISVAISLFLGLVIGVLISEFRKPAQIIMNIINVLYTIPSISMLGFLIPFTGIGNKTAIIALSIYGLLPIVRNTYTGINTIQPFLTEVASGHQNADPVPGEAAFGSAGNSGGCEKYGGDDDFLKRNCFLYRGRRTGCCHLQRDNHQ